MSRIKMLLVSLALICSSSFVSAQAGARPTPVAEAAALVMQGKLDQAISTLQGEVDAPDRTDAQRGRAYSVLGYAYREQGKFAAAEKAFDRALRLMDKAGDRSSNYAATLDFYAGMLMSTGDLDTASKALREATNIYQRLENHAALSKIHIHTAELQIERKKYKQAGEELAGARAEAVRANSEPRMSSEIDATAGWLAVSTRKYHDGVAAYSASLEECRKQFGDDHAATGWSYLLLGKAQQLDHDLAGAARSMDKGLAILEQTLGKNNVRYLVGELAYSELLHDEGSLAEAARISSEVNQTMRSLGMQPCAPACAVSVWGLGHPGGM